MQNLISKLNLGKDCEDDNECKSSITNDCEDICNNQPKSDDYPLGYVCSCETGYELSADGFHCIDINECKSVFLFYIAIHLRHKKILSIVEHHNKCENKHKNEEFSLSCSCLCDPGYKLMMDLTA